MRRILDQYPTQAGVVNTLLNFMEFGDALVCEPSAGEGAIARVLQQRGYRTVTNDLDRSYIDLTDYVGYDARDPNAVFWQENPDWIVTNPPFNQAIDILRTSWNQCRIGVAFLLRLSFLEPAGKRSGNRGEWLHAHEDNMRFLIPFGQKRPSFTNDGKTDRVTTAWMVWDKRWSWKKLGIVSPFGFAMNWRETI